MGDPTLVFVEETPDGRPAVVCNFGLHAGRDATQAEIERLGASLVADADPVDVIAEHRYRFDSERAATVHQLRVELPETVAAASVPNVAGVVEAWARDCIDERRLATP
jgi:hypothetical protein